MTQQVNITSFGPSSACKHQQQTLYASHTFYSNL